MFATVCEAVGATNASPEQRTESLVPATNHAARNPGGLMNAPLKTGVNLHVAICGTDVLLCQQLWSWGCRLRASGWFRAT